MDVEKPDEKSIMTYVAQFLEKYPDPDLDDDSPKDKVRLVHVVFVVEFTYMTLYKVSLHSRFLCVFTGAGVHNKIYDDLHSMNM